MLEPAPVRTREELLIRLAGTFSTVSSLVYQPVGQPRGTALCIHDFAGNANDFEPLASHLVTAGQRVVCPDIVGRGQSAYVDGEYSVRIYLNQLMGLIESYRDTEITLIGSGWGGLLALLLVHLVNFRPARLILADLHLDWSASTDPDFVAAAQLVPERFPNRDAGTAAILAHAAFIGALPDWALRLAANRLGSNSPGSFKLCLDPKIIHGMRFADHVYDVTRMISPLTIPTLLLWGRPLSAAENAKLTASPSVTTSRLDNLTKGGRVRFTTPAELAAVSEMIAP